MMRFWRRPNGAPQTCGQTRRSKRNRVDAQTLTVAVSTQRKTAAVIADFQKNDDRIRLAAQITKLRLADIVFDSKMLRVIAEAEAPSMSP